MTLPSFLLCPCPCFSPSLCPQSKSPPSPLWFLGALAHLCAEMFPPTPQHPPGSSLACFSSHFPGAAIPGRPVTCLLPSSLPPSHLYLLGVALYLPGIFLPYLPFVSWSSMQAPCRLGLCLSGTAAPPGPSPALDTP